MRDSDNWSQIDTSNKLLVKATLGYQNDVDLFTGEQKGASKAARTHTSSSKVRARHKVPNKRMRDRKISCSWTDEVGLKRCFLPHV